MNFLCHFHSLRKIGLDSKLRHNDLYSLCVSKPSLFQVTEQNNPEGCETQQISNATQRLIHDLFNFLSFECLHRNMSALSKYA